MGRGGQLRLLGQHVLENTLVKSLLNELEHTVFQSGTFDHGGCSGGYYLRYEAVGAEEIGHKAVDTINQRHAYKGERGEESRITISHVRQGDGVVVAPGR